MTLFTSPTDPSLNRSVAEVPIKAIRSAEIQAIIDRMLFIAQGERNDLEKKTLVGLAAPQIGIQKRIILVDTGVNSERRNLGTLTAYINPKIVWYSSTTVRGRESCYSVDSRLAGLVPLREHQNRSIGSSR